MIVVGGVYSEYCYQPDWNQIFGSGGRGAAALTRLGVDNVKLFTCLPEKSRKSAHATLSPYGLEIEALPSAALYQFSYLHPLSEPTLNPKPETVDTFQPISSDLVLAYGMLEGLPKISARRAIFDPQSETRFKFAEDFIQAKEMALVLNQREFELVYGLENPEKTAEADVRRGTVCCVIIKRGPLGCTVIDKSGMHSIPVFPTRSVFKIGSGDIFSASFAKFWGIDNLSAPQAAENASKCTSLYCDTRSIDSISLLSEFNGQALNFSRRPHVYLAGPFFSLAQKFLVEEARTALLGLGARVFSPMHEVGFDQPSEIIAMEDLKGLEQCSVVLALITDLDPGTIFEIGYARARNIPVVAHGEGVKQEHLTMIIGSQCTYNEDFCSSLYNAVWAGM